MEIKVQKVEQRKQKPDYNNLTFGDYFTDHMFIMNYTAGQGWHDARIVPYGDIALSPAAMCLHYGQEVFEGMKAYHAADGRTLLFRPRKNFERMNVSNERLCVPPIDVDFVMKALKELIKIDAEWIPQEDGTSLYIRPFIIAVDPHLGVRAGHEYLFIIILSPVGSYYKEGLNPVKIWVENKYVRAVRGGMGFAKTGGNYAASLKAQEDAHEFGYSQVLWLDGVERKYIEEVGAMNVFFKINGEYVTPALQGSILPGITRMSCIELLKHWGEPVAERRLSVDELAEAAESGALEEAFGSGTAAVISPIGELHIGDRAYTINGGKIGDMSHKLYKELTDLQYGRSEDVLGWTEEVEI
ncbi:MAG: branched-chain amino acid aminotransferase [Clostridia bacterium]|nr:branched-chain amino acid aminotransferase [Clostridia bacterium]MBR4439361.1 branched-chain amino acid aminotransferase [Clostridia bacterium]